MAEVETMTVFVVYVAGNKVDNNGGGVKCKLEVSCY